MTPRDGRGWHKEPARHGLAARGIKTGRKKYDKDKYAGLGRMILEPMKVTNIQEDFPDQRITKENAQREIAKVIREAFIQSGSMSPSAEWSVKMEDKFYQYLVKDGKGKIEGRFEVHDKSEARPTVGVVIAKIKDSQIARMKIWIGPGPKRFQPAPKPLEEIYAEVLAERAAE